MLEALSATGWRNYSLFLAPDGMLIGYLETDDFQAALRGMEETDVNVRWQAEMGEFFEDLEGRRPDEGLLVLDEVFHLECAAPPPPSPCSFSSTPPRASAPCTRWRTASSSSTPARCTASSARTAPASQRS